GGAASRSESPSQIGSAPTSGPALPKEPGYGSLQWARASFTGGFPGSAFLPQADGTLLCPAGRVLSLVERSPERAGSVRVSYAACLVVCGFGQIRARCVIQCIFKARPLGS